MERFTFVFRPSYSVSSDRSSQRSLRRGASTKHGSKRPMAVSGSASDEVVTGARIESTQNEDRPNG
jgi:hypothetical protein